MRASIALCSVLALVACGGGGGGGGGGNGPTQGFDSKKPATLHFASVSPTGPVLAGAAVVSSSSEATYDPNTGKLTTGFADDYSGRARPRGSGARMRRATGCS